MKLKAFTFIGFFFLLTFFVTAITGYAQSTTDTKSPQELYRKIVYLDSSLFANIYTCNPSKNVTFLAEDFEFYHDRSGLTKSRKSFMERLEQNFCGEQDGFKLRRELVSGSMKVYSLGNYGVVQTGEHRFYQTTKDQKERLVEIAKFTHVWQNQNGDWRLSRVISYDHQEAK